MHEQKDGRPWGKWVAPQILAQADKLKAARALFDQTLKDDADPRLAFFTLHVCYRKSRRFIEQVAEIWPDAHSGDMYSRLVQHDQALKERLQETLAPKEFNEIKERLQAVLSDIGF